MYKFYIFIIHIYLFRIYNYICTLLKNLFLRAMDTCATIPICFIFYMVWPVQQNLYKSTYGLCVLLKCIGCCRLDGFVALNILRAHVTLTSSFCLNV